MAPNATIYKVMLHIADMDRHYYQDHAVTLARHPSETDERMMVRLVAFALHADETLLFGRGLGTTDEPALWQKDLTGAIALWIEVGLPDDRIIRQAAGRAAKVVVYAYGGRSADLWWKNHAATLERVNNLAVMTVPQDGSRLLAKLTQRSMELDCTIQEGQVSVGDGTNVVTFELTTMKLAFHQSRRGA